MLGAVVAAIMAASFFMPWIEIFGQELGPMALLEQDSEVILNLSWQGWAFLTSFVIAALAAFLAILRRAAGALMLIAGGIPFAIIAESAMRAKGQLDELGLPIPRADGPLEALKSLSEIMAIGLPAYFISAAVLVLIGLGRMVRGA